MIKNLHSYFLNSQRIKYIAILCVICFFAFSSQLHAQLALSLGLDRSSYLLHEPVYAKIFVRNYSGRGLIFGKNKALKGKIEFEIHGPDGKIIKPFNNTIEPLKNMVLNPGATGDVIVPVSRIYHVNKAGNYTIKAIISHPRLTKAYESKTGGFTIFNGIPVWKRFVGVPDVLNTDGKIKIKTRTAKIFSFFDGDKKMFALCVEDAKFIYGVIRLADDIGNKPPQCEVDGLSRIHILVQISPKVFSYFVYDLNCRLNEKETFARSAEINPRLVRNPEQGTVMVAGGRKAVKGKDFIEENYNPMFIEGIK